MVVAHSPLPSVRVGVRKQQSRIATGKGHLVLGALCHKSPRLVELCSLLIPTHLRLGRPHRQRRGCKRIHKTG
jgi:hypothetical protein